MKNDTDVKSEKKQDENRSKAVPVLSTTAGAIAGGVATSSPAITAGGVAGLTGYSLGLGGLVAHVGCGSAAAMGALSMVAAGPILGGVIGYSAYRAVKNLRNQNRKNGRNGDNGNSKDKQ